MISQIRSHLEEELSRTEAELSARRVAGVPTAEPTADPTGDPHAVDLERQLQSVEHLLDALATAEPGSIALDRAGLGSTLELLDLDDSSTMICSLSIGDDVDVDAGEISLASPIGDALLGCAEGDEISVATPRGMRRFRILELTTLPQRLGLAELPAVAS